MFYLQGGWCSVKYFDLLIILTKCFICKVVGVPSGTRLVIANGKLIGPFDADESFALEDFALLEKYAASTLTDKITESLKGAFILHHQFFFRSFQLINFKDFSKSVNYWNSQLNEIFFSYTDSSSDLNSFSFVLYGTIKNDNLFQRFIEICQLL